MMPSCPRCNLLKRTHTLEEFREETAAQVARLALRSDAYRLAKSYALIVETGIKIKFYFAGLQ